MVSSAKRAVPAYLSRLVSTAAAAGPSLQPPKSLFVSAPATTGFEAQFPHTVNSPAANRLGTSNAGNPPEPRLPEPDASGGAVDSFETPSSPALFTTQNVAEIALQSPVVPSAQPTPHAKPVIPTDMADLLPDGRSHGEWTSNISGTRVNRNDQVERSGGPTRSEMPQSAGTALGRTTSDAAPGPRAIPTERTTAITEAPAQQAPRGANSHAANPVPRREPQPADAHPSAHPQASPDSEMPGRTTTPATHVSIGTIEVTVVPPPLPQTPIPSPNQQNRIDHRAAPSADAARRAARRWHGAGQG